MPTTDPHPVPIAPTDQPPHQDVHGLQHASHADETEMIVKLDEDTHLFESFDELKLSARP